MALALAAVVAAGAAALFLPLLLLLLLWLLLPPLQEDALPLLPPDHPRSPQTAAVVATMTPTEMRMTKTGRRLNNGDHQ